MLTDVVQKMTDLLQKLTDADELTSDKRPTKQQGSQGCAPRAVSSLRMLFFRLSFGVAVIACGLLVGCKPLPPSKDAALFTVEEARGARVFQVRCAECHNAISTKGKKGPGLQALTKLKEMPSGAPPSDERLTQTIRHGHGMMPGQAVGDEELGVLLAYLKTL